MKKTILLLTAVCVFKLFIPAQNLESKKAKFIDAKPGECWRINDDWTRIYDKVESSYDDFRYIFRNKYSLTWHDIEHTKTLIDKYKHVFVLETTGYVERWKYVKYGKTSNGNICIKYGWILATKFYKYFFFLVATNPSPFSVISPHLPTEKRISKAKRHSQQLTNLARCLIEESAPRY